MRIETLEDLLWDELRELYDAERRLVMALPGLAKQSGSERLRRAFEEHLQETRAHLQRLEQCFNETGRSPGRQASESIRGLLRNGERVSASLRQSPLRDAALICAARCVEHYEAAAYGGAISLARALGHERVANLLKETFDEEKRADEKLSEIAETLVNQKAMQLGAHQKVHTAGG